MKEMIFNVDGPYIKLDRTNSDNVVTGDTVRLFFNFSSEWDALVKVLKFTRGDVELTPCVLRNGNTCVIPSEVMDSTYFRMRVIGRSADREHCTQPILINL